MHRPACRQGRAQQGGWPKRRHRPAARWGGAGSLNRAREPQRPPPPHAGGRDRAARVTGSPVRRRLRGNRPRAPPPAVVRRPRVPEGVRAATAGQEPWPGRTAEAAVPRRGAAASVVGCSACGGSAEFGDLDPGACPGARKPRCRDAWMTRHRTPAHRRGNRRSRGQPRLDRGGEEDCRPAAYRGRRSASGGSCRAKRRTAPVRLRGRRSSSDAVLVGSIRRKRRLVLALGEKTASSMMRPPHSMPNGQTSSIKATTVDGPRPAARGPCRGRTSFEKTPDAVGRGESASRVVIKDACARSAAVATSEVGTDGFRPAAGGRTGLRRPAPRTCFRHHLDC